MLLKKICYQKIQSYSIGKRVSTWGGCKLEIERKKRHWLKYIEKIKACF